MPDREKVIERLSKVSYYFKSLLEVGWQGDADIYREYMESVNMALTLLREQEPVKPIFDEEDVSGRCGVCGHALTHQSMVGEVLVEEWFQYCPRCGRKVKWDAL